MTCDDPLHHLYDHRCRSSLPNPQTTNRKPRAATKRGSGSRLHCNDNRDVVHLPEKGVGTNENLEKELPNLLNRNINLWNEKEEGRIYSLSPQACAHA